MAGHYSDTEHVDFSPDGRYLASVGKNDTLRFREPASGRQVGEPLDITMVGGHRVHLIQRRWSPRLPRRQKHANRWRFIVCRWRHLPGARACRLGRCTVRETHHEPQPGAVE